MAFLHHNICDSWLIVFLQFNTGISDGQELVVKNLHKEKKVNKCRHNSTRSNQKRNRPGHRVATFDCHTYLWQLSFRNSISVENNARGLEAGGFVELNEQLSHHVGQILNDLLPRPLDSHGGAVPAGMSIHTANHLENSVLKCVVTAVVGQKYSICTH